MWPFQPLLPAAEELLGDGYTGSGRPDDGQFTEFGLTGTPEAKRAAYTDKGVVTYTYVGSGGAVTGGSATLDKIKSYTPTGGAVAGGSATLAKIKTYTPDGGAVTGGSATLDKIKAYVGSGGAVTDGAATTAFVPPGATTYSYTGSGGAVAAGTADVDKVKNYTPTGGAVTGGAATLAKTKAYVPSGGATTDGAAFVDKIKAYLATGGAETGGAAITGLLGLGSWGYVGSGGAETGGEAFYAFLAAALEPVAEERSGGYGWSNAHQIELRRLLRRKLRLQDDEEQVARILEVRVDPQASELKRLKALVAAYEPSGAKTAKAVAYARQAQTTLAYELALRAIARELDDEEHAVLMTIALLD